MSETFEQSYARVNSGHYPYPDAHRCEEWVGSFTPEGDARACGEIAPFEIVMTTGASMWVCADHRPKRRDESL